MFCDRCLRTLTPGDGDFFQVAIEAVADPTPPKLDPGREDRADLERRLASLIRDLDDVSPQEAMDQVRRRLTLHLCTPCYREWIENPTGGA